MEQWKNIKGFENYLVSDLGRVQRNGKILKQQKRKKDGYWVLNLSKEGKHFKCKVHRLVAIAFIDNPENKKQVNHLQGKDDNRAIHLCWATGSENMQHSFDHGTHISPACKGSSNGRAKLNEKQISEIRTKANTHSNRSLAREYGVSNVLIGKILNLQLWQHL